MGNAFVGAKGLIVSLFSVFFFSSLLAKNYKIIGADISYKYIGYSSYRIKLNIYTECTGDPLDTVRIMVSAADKTGSSRYILAKITDVGDVTMSGYNVKTECNDPSSSQTGIHEWKAVATVALNTDSSCRYIFSWQADNRLDAVNGRSNQPFYIEAYMNACDYTEMGSPEFINKPFFFYSIRHCITKYNEISDSSWGKGAISYKYRLVPPRDAANEDFVFSNGYSYNKPFYFTGYPSVPPDSFSCTGFYFDSTKGSFKSTAYFEESFPIAIELEKYMNGKLVSRTCRDMTYFAENFGINHNPVISGVNNSPAQSASFFVGTENCFDVSTYDEDPDDTVYWRKAEFTDPGAHITIDENQRWPTLHFCWTPAHATTPMNPYILFLEVADRNKPCIEDIEVCEYTTRELRVFVQENPNSIAQYAKPQLHLYPLPAGNVLKISGYSGNAETMMAMDMTGRIFKLPFCVSAGGIVVETADLPAAEYTLLIISKSGIAEGRFVKATGY